MCDEINLSINFGQAINIANDVYDMFPVYQTKKFEDYLDSRIGTDKITLFGALFSCYSQYKNREDVIKHLKKNEFSSILLSPEFHTSWDSFEFEKYRQVLSVSELFDHEQIIYVPISYISFHEDMKRYLHEYRN